MIRTIFLGSTRISGHSASQEDSPGFPGEVLSVFINVYTPVFLKNESNILRAFFK